jgi:hypothetical protein
MKLVSFIYNNMIFKEDKREDIKFSILELFIFIYKKHFS